MTDTYHEDLLDEAKNPSNIGKIENPDLFSTQYNASCGDVISVTIRLSSDKKKIEDIKWKGQGCIISQASMSVLSEKIKGMELSKLIEINQDEILKDLGLENITVGRIKCLNLGLSAIKKLAKDI
ncbi:iron-sulfur cluster assembly scaffold protein [Candidatus Woesebacteria bacterium]|nr:iron-sulfur cluster assembly scaffold protein [Candidatus Woesebacteria bacterium]